MGTRLNRLWVVEAGAYASRWGRVFPNAEEANAWALAQLRGFAGYTAQFTVPAEWLMTLRWLVTFMDLSPSQIDTLRWKLKGGQGVVEMIECDLCGGTGHGCGCGRCPDGVCCHCQGADEYPADWNAGGPSYTDPGATPAKLKYKPNPGGAEE